jgi:phenylalanyl-tRNA synthetase beta chain
MNIKIVDSWLREFLQTKASVKEVAKQLSLTSVSVEKTEKIGEDFVYDIEVTTNRPDLMSVTAVAREAAVALEQEKTPAKFVDLKTPNIQKSSNKFPIDIKADPKLVNRICAVVMEVEISQSPKEISQRLELSGIRSLNNLIDVTNYVMRETGHPAHVFDFDLLTSKKMIIRESKENEKLTTLDGKTYSLLGGDIIADDGSGLVIDLLGVMGTKNSVVNEKTKRILFFLDNNNPLNIRKTSMSLGIRTEAAIINEKGIDPQATMDTLIRGIELYEKIAKGKVISEIFDWYPEKLQSAVIKVDIEKIDKIIGVNLGIDKSAEILENLGFKVKKNSTELEVEPPTTRQDVKIDEDVIEEIARIYGYHKLPSIIPTFISSKTTGFANNFYFENRIKNAFKYLGFTECYTYSLVSEDLFEGPMEDAIKLKNPLSKDMAVLRNTLIPSLLGVEKENPKNVELKIFELSNIYMKKAEGLPDEILTLSGLIKEKNANFYAVKGIIEIVLQDLGITNLIFKTSSKGGMGASVFIDRDYLGEIEVLDQNLIDFELNFEIILKHATLKKTFTPFAKFPPIVEDISLIADAQTQDIINEMKSVDLKIADVTLKDTFENSRTFHVEYRDFAKNLTKEEVGKIREKILTAIKDKFKDTIKE